VFNCSDAIDEEVVIRIAAAAAANPSTWLVFDELNRITADAMSALLRAMVALGPCRAALAAFTYNPGYAGGSEVPAVAGLGPAVDMTVPDFEMIIEVMLAMEGLAEYSQLAQPIEATRLWCNEQLSKQHWYDWGLRSLKQFFRHCGRMKRETPEISDTAIVARAFWSGFAAPCVAADLEMLEKQLCEVFGEDGEHQNGSAYLEELPTGVKRSMGKVSAEESMQWKLAHFLEVSKVRHGMGVVTETPREAVQALSLLAAEEGVMMMYLGYQKGAPLLSKDGAMTPQDLYGQFEDGQWEDGTFTSALKMACEGTRNTWLVVDGELDAVLMEPANSLLDDNKRLYLENGESVMLKPNVRVVYVLNRESLGVMSPANVSRLGMINFETAPASGGWFW